MAGLTTQGLVIATLEELIDECRQRLRNQFGAGLPVDDSTAEGQLVIIIMEALAKVWEVVEQVNSSQDRDKATGAGLDACVALTGTVRDAATFSTATLTLTGDEAAVVPEGSQVSTGLDFRLATDEEKTLELVDSWVGATVYAVGDRVTNFNRVYQCTTAGTSAAAGGPASSRKLITCVAKASFTDGETVTIDLGTDTVVYEIDRGSLGGVTPGRVLMDISAVTTAIQVAAIFATVIAANQPDLTVTDNGNGTVTITADDDDMTITDTVTATAFTVTSLTPGVGEDETDGTVTWMYLGDGNSAADVTATATETGPNAVPARSATSIETPENGWLGVINVAAGSTGTDQETDEELRVKQQIEVARPGTGPLKAIRAALLDVASVTSVKMFQNTTSATDADGMPPNTVEALVQGGEDQDIFDTLIDNVVGGITTYGNTTGTATDDEGTVHTMKFSRPVEVPIYVTITLTYDADDYPADGDDQVAEAIVEFGNGDNRTGIDAIATAIQAQAFSIDGVHKVVSCFIGIAPTPASSNDIAITSRQLATFDVDNIIVNSSAASI